MLRDESGDTDTEVDVEAIVDFASRATSDTMPPVLGRIGGGSSGIGGRGLCVGILGKGDNLDFLGSGGLDDAVDVDTGDVNRVGGN